MNTKKINNKDLIHVERYNKNYKMLKTQFELIVVKSLAPHAICTCGFVAKLDKC